MVHKNVDFEVSQYVPEQTDIQLEELEADFGEELKKSTSDLSDASTPNLSGDILDSGGNQDQLQNPENNKTFEIGYLETDVDLCSEQDLNQIHQINSTDLVVDERMNNREPLEIEDNEQTTQKADSPPWYKRIAGLGFILIIAKVFSKTLVDMIVRQLDSVHPIVILFYRSMTMMTIMMPVSVATNSPPFPSDRTLKERLLLILRGVIDCLSTMASFYSLQHMPLGDQRMLVACRSLVTLISARIFLKEAFGIFETISAVLMMSGIVLVLRPPFIFGNLQSGDFYDEEYLPAALTILASIVLSGNIQVILRYLRKEALMSILVTRELEFSMITYCIINIAGLPFFLLTAVNRAQVLAMACAACMTQSFNVLATKVEEASKLSMVERSVSVILGFILQIAWYNNLPGLLSYLGAALVLSSILMLGSKKICFNKFNNARVKRDPSGA